MRLFSKRGLCRTRGSFKSGILLTAAAFIFVLALLTADHRFSSLQSDAVSSALTSFAQEKIAESVSEYLSGITVKYENNYVILDTYYLNKMKTELVNELQKDLTGKTVIWIPIGNFTDSAFLNGRGVKVPFVFSVNAAVDISFESDITDAGINRTKYSVSMFIRTQLYSLTDRVSECVDVESSFLLYESVLNGNIPACISNIR